MVATATVTMATVTVAMAMATGIAAREAAMVATAGLAVAARHISRTVCR